MEEQVLEVFRGPSPHYLTTLLSRAQGPSQGLGAQLGSGACLDLHLQTWPSASGMFCDTDLEGPFQEPEALPPLWAGTILYYSKVQ